MVAIFLGLFFVLLLILAINKGYSMTWREVVLYAFGLAVVGWAVGAVIVIAWRYLP